MKHRVKLDLSFVSEADAILLMNYAKSKAKVATSINEGAPNEEISYCGYELCGHDSGQPCQMLERVEVRKILPILSSG